MSHLLLTDTSGRLVQSIENAAFSEMAFQQAAVSGGALSLVPCTRQDEQGRITLRYSTENLIPLSRRLPEMDSAVFYSFLERFVHILLGIHLAKGFSIGGIVTDFEFMYCDLSDNPLLLYTFQEPCDDSAPQQRQVLLQLRQLVSVRTPETAELWKCIDDPFCDLFVLNTFFSLRTAKPNGGSVTVVPRQAPFRGAQPARSEESEDSGIINAVRGSINMVSKQSSFTSPETSYTCAPGFDMDQPTQDESNASQKTTKRMTADTPNAQAHTGFAIGMDQSTADDPAYQPFSANPRMPQADAPTSVAPRGTGRHTDDAEQRVLSQSTLAVSQKTLTDIPKLPATASVQLAPHTRKIPDGIPVDEWQEYLKKRDAFWRAFGLLIGGMVCAAMLGMVIGAFGGFVGVLLYLMVAMLGVAVLINRGRLDALRPFKKPKPLQPEPKAPNIEAVFSVRIKLRSTNLTSPMEITVRHQDQLIGSDRRCCSSPLPFEGISRRHFRIISTKVAGHTDYSIRDENSTNGTELNGQRLKPGKDYPLHVGDRITLAHRYVFVVCSDAY